MSGADLPSSISSSSEPAVELAPEGVLERIAARFTSFSERYIPDAYVFALVATFVVFAAAVTTTDRTAGDVVEIWGKGFFELLAFTLQMALIVVTGYVVSTSPPVHRAIGRLASLPKTSEGAATMIALVAMASAWVNWGFGLMFSAMLAKETARRVPEADYKTLAACSFMGLGSIWAQGLSGSAALQMSSPTAMPAATREIVSHGGLVEDGVIPLAHTIFLWQSFAAVAIEVVVVTLLVYFAAPRKGRARNAASLGIELEAAKAEEPIVSRGTPGEWLEHSRILPALFFALAAAYLVRHFARAPSALGAVSFDSINLFFLATGVLLHGTPARLMRAFRDATPSVWAILLQYPLYAGIAAMISKTHLNESIASAFVSISTRETFPALIAVYSAVLGIFVPSGGSKWVIEAPYVMQAAHELRVHLGWMVAVYDLGEAVANLIQPFWMLPVLGIFRLRAKDVMGFTFLVFLVLAPLVLILVTVFGMTLRYPL